MRRSPSRLLMTVVSVAVMAIAVTVAGAYVYLRDAPAAGSSGPGTVTAQSPAANPETATAPTAGTPDPKPAKVHDPAPANRTYSWCTSAQSGSFTTPDGEYLVYTDEWHSTLPQSVCASTEADWQVTFNAPAGQTAILTYPDVQLNYRSSPPAVSSLDPAATSRFAETMNANSGTSAEAAYDILLTNGTRNRSEVMIWVDTLNRHTFRAATYLGSKTFCGQSWELWLYRRELIWYLPANEQAGTVCAAQMLQNLQSRSLLPRNASLRQFEFGWEIASTGGIPETFQMSAYSTHNLPPAN